MSAIPLVNTAHVILLVAPAGRFQESLRVLLAGLQLHVVGPAAEARSALALLQAWRPTLVVLDFAVPTAELTEILLGLQTEWPTVRLVALVDSVEQLTEAKAWGIKNVLLRGFRLEELYTAITAQLAGVDPSDQTVARPAREV
jgi:DNA-binding NarL/FixJ family response regulator